MKILFTISNANFSGAEQQLLNLAIGMRSKGHNCIFCNLEGYGPFIDEIKNNEFEYVVFERNNSYDLKRLYIYRNYVKNESFDIIQSFCSSANNYTRLISLGLSKKPIIVSGERGRGFKSIFERVTNRLLSHFSDFIITNSISQKNLLVQKENISENKLGVIHNGIDLIRFENAKSISLHTELKLEKNVKIICSIGNLSHHKNIPFLIDIAENISKLRNDIFFIYVGSGPNFQYYKNKVVEKNLSNTLSFVGRKEYIPSILKSCDLFLLTSNWEGMPNVVLEAMACGLSIVSTPVNGVKELINDRINGILVPVGDIKKMTKEIINLVENSRLREKIGIEAKKRAEYFRMSKMVQQYEDLYLRLLTHG